MIGQEQQSGFSFPLVQLKGRTPLRYLTDDTLGLIKASIRQILLTSPGERMWLPDFGSRLRELHFENMSNTIDAIVANLVIEAITKWEPRVAVTPADIQVTKGDGVVQISIRFRVKNPDFANSDVTSVLIEL